MNLRRVLLPLLVAGSAAFVAPASAVASSPCTNSWLGGDGNWFVATHWSSGSVPGPNDAVCITEPGDYTVTVPGGPAGSPSGQAAADTLALGGASGTQRLVIQADNSCGDTSGAGGLEVFDHGGVGGAASVGTNGQMELTQDGNTCSGVANDTYVRVDGGTLSNAGLIFTDTGGVNDAAATGRLIQGSIANTGGTFQIDANTTWSGATFDNAGSLSLASASVLTVPADRGATFTNDAGGTITNSVTHPLVPGYVLVLRGNTFREGAGTVNPGLYERPGVQVAVIVHGATLTYTADVSSSIEVQGESTLVGDVPSQARLAIQCTATENAVLHASSFTNAGFIGLYGTNDPNYQTEPCSSRFLSVDSSAGPGTGTLTNAGHIQGFGTIAGNVSNTTGTVVPGDSHPPCTPCIGAYTPGLLAITGNYTQGSGGTLGAINLPNCPRCTSPAYSQLSVQGTASLDGTLEVLTGGLTRPATGDAYQILVAGSVIGRFTALDGQLDPSSDAMYVPVYNPTNVTVDVVKLPELTINRAGRGAGTVTSSPAGIDCGTGFCASGFPDGQAVSLTATAAAGSRFAGWSGSSCHGRGTCTVTMTGDRSVKATFTLIPGPRCTLRLKSRTVKLTTHRRNRARHHTGTLTATVRCDKQSRLKLSGTLTEWLGSRRKPRTKHFRLRPVIHAARPHRITTLIVTLPPAALRALEHGHRETIKLTLSASTIHATTQISTRQRTLIRPK